jgi:hypothetical protein
VCVTDEEQLVGIMEAGLAQRAVTGAPLLAAGRLLAVWCLVRACVRAACNACWSP